MSTTQNLKMLTLIAGADLQTTALHLNMSIDSTGRAVVAGVNDIIVGTLVETQNNGVVTTGNAIPVAANEGIKLYVASAAISAGDVLVAAAAGKVAGVADIASVPADTVVLGMALEAAAADDDLVRGVALNGGFAHTA